MAERVAAHLRAELEIIDTELNPLLRAPFEINKAISTEITYLFFIYDRNRLRYWSDNTFVPPALLLADTFSIKLLRIGREAYLLKKDVIDEDHYVISLIALLR